MGTKSPVSAEQDQEMMATLWSDPYRLYPERAVMYGMPWGVPGTPLEKIKKPRAWQLKDLAAYGAHIRRNKQLLEQGLPLELYQEATCSGRGIGKSALIGMKAWFHMTCWPGSTTIAAANGEPQLDSKTFPEIKKWFTWAINSHWFDLNARSVRPTDWFKESIQKQLKIDCGYYYVQGQLWTEEKPDAFAGAHNPLGLMVFFDEASGIPSSIWTVTVGFFTEPCITKSWFAYSNGRKNTGAFFECFHKFRDFWVHKNIDSRTVEGVDASELDKIIKKHGEDSDEARIEVLGKFPRQGDRQFISREKAQKARMRVTEVDDTGAALTMAVDVARFGEDRSVITYKRGRDAKKIPSQKFKKTAITELARNVIAGIDTYDPDAVFVDGGGVGGGLVDILKESKYGDRIIEVQFGETADEPMRWADKRTECWGLMDEWLDVGAIEDSQDLEDDLCGPEFDYKGKDNAKKLESKEHMKDRGLASPDEGDSLALHFAKRISRRDTRGNRRNRNRIAEGADPDLFSE